MELQQGTPEQPNVQLNVRIPLELMQRIDKLAKDNYRSKNMTVVMLLEQATK